MKEMVIGGEEEEENSSRLAVPSTHACHVIRNGNSFVCSQGPSTLPISAAIPCHFYEMAERDSFKTYGIRIVIPAIVIYNYRTCIITTT